MFFISSTLLLSSLVLSTLAAPAYRVSDALSDIMQPSTSLKCTEGKGATPEDISRLSQILRDTEAGAWRIDPNTCRSISSDRVGFQACAGPEAEGVEIAVAEYADAVESWPTLCANEGETGELRFPIDSVIDTKNFFTLAVYHKEVEQVDPGLDE